MDSSTYVYDEDIRPIDSIEFNILGNLEILEISALGKDSIGIDIPDLYDNMEPKRGGLIDTRLGTTDNNTTCATCGLDSTDCVGHFGHIVLAEAAFHMGLIQYVKKFLSCICLKCSKILIYKNEAELYVNKYCDCFIPINNLKKYKDIHQLFNFAKTLVLLS